jgi:hypothetical protein
MILDIDGKVYARDVLCINNNYYVVKSCRRLKYGNYRVRLILQEDA